MECNMEITDSARIAMIKTIQKIRLNRYFFPTFLISLITQSSFGGSHSLPQYGQFFDLKELKLAPQLGHWIFAMEKFVENGTSVLLAAVI